MQLHPKVKQALESFGISYKIFPCDPTLADTAAFCEHYHFQLSQSANTIIVASKTDPIQYVCCVVLATTKLDVNKKVCQLLGAKKASFASADQTKLLTDMEIGGVTAPGISDMSLYVDSAVFEQQEIVMGGGNRSTKILLDPKELHKIPDMQVVEQLAQPKTLS